MCLCRVYTAATSADLWDLQRLGYGPGQAGHMLACDFQSAAAHALPLIFILAGFIRLKLCWVVLYADLIGKIA